MSRLKPVETLVRLVKKGKSHKILREADGQMVTALFVDAIAAMEYKADKGLQDYEIEPVIAIKFPAKKGSKS